MSIAAQPATPAHRARPRPLAARHVASGRLAPRTVANPGRALRRITVLALAAGVGLALVVAGVAVAVLHTMSRLGR